MCIEYLVKAALYEPWPMKVMKMEAVFAASVMISLILSYETDVKCAQPLVRECSCIMGRGCGMI